MKIQNLILAFYDKNQYENIASKRKTYNVTVTEAINRHTLALDNEKNDSFEIISSSEQDSRSSCDEQESEEEIDLETGNLLFRSFGRIDHVWSLSLTQILKKT